MKQRVAGVVVLFAASSFAQVGAELRLNQAVPGLDRQAYTWPIASLGSDVFVGVTAEGDRGLVLKVNPAASGSSVVVTGVPTFPGGGATFANRAVFGQYVDTSYGVNALWSTDGTSSGTSFLAGQVLSDERGPIVQLGTRLVFAVNAGPNQQALAAFDGSSTVVLAVTPDPRRFAVSGGMLYFSGASASSGTELWKTDGTIAGTSMVVDTNPGTGSGLFAVWASAADGVVFTGTDGVTQSTYLTKGSAGTTVKLAGLPSVPVPFSDSVVSVGAGFLLSAFDGVSNRTHLYWFGSGSTTALDVPLPTANPFTLGASNGTWAVVHETSGYSTTSAVWAWNGASLTRLRSLDIVPRASREYPTDGGFIFVGQAPDAGTGHEPWYSNGTTAGTVLLGDFTPGAGDSYGAIALAAPGGGAVLTVNDGIYITDGTAAGTRLLDVVPTTITNAKPYGAVSAGARLFCSWVDGDASTQVGKLAVTDGTWAGTTPVPSSAPVNSSGAVTGDRLVYFHSQPGLGAEPWSTDGTSAPVLLRDIFPGISGSFLAEPVSAHGRVYFVAQDLTGAHLWRTDGTDAGTTLVVANGPAMERQLLTMGGSLYAFTANWAGLQRVSSADSGTSVVALLPSGSSGVSSAVAQDRLYFNSPADVTELWTSDGTPAGTRAITHLWPAGQGGGNFVFNGAQGSNPMVNLLSPDGGHALFLVDATDGGLSFVLDLRPYDGLGTQWLSSMSSAPGRASYFVLDDGVHGTEPWVTDGTAAGTHLLKDIAPGHLSSMSSTATFLGYGQVVYFSADDGVHGSELWSTDGTAAGTSMLVELVDGGRGSDPKPLAVAGCKLYLSAVDRERHRDLWTVSSLPGSGVAPGITGIVVGPRGDAGWYTGPVTVHFERDSGFPLIDSCPDVAVTADTPGFTATCIATSECGARSTSALVIRKDGTPPVVQCPTLVTLEAIGPDAGVLAKALADAGDALSAVVVSYEPPLGTSLPMGESTTTFSAADEAGNTASCPIPIKVQDTSPPSVTCPMELSVVATSAQGAQVLFAVTATDVVDPSPSVKTTIDAGSVFPIGGPTRVTATAVDASGNVATCSFTVTVTEPPPTLTCPGAVTVTATTAGGAVATFDVHAADAFGAPLDVSLTQASGTVFPPGSTNVTASVTDSSGHQQSCTFTVTVQSGARSRYAWGCGCSSGEGADVWFPGLALLGAAWRRRSRSR